MRVSWGHVLIWAMVLVYFTCSKTPFLFHLSGFQLNRHPDFRQLYLMDLDFADPNYTISKMGHCLGFMTLDLLLSARLRRPRTALFIAVCFGCFTEFAQLFLYRDGRIYDVVIDSIGAFIAFYFLSPWFKRMKRRDTYR